MCDNIEKSVDPMSGKKKKCFLNVIRDRDYTIIKNLRDNLSLSDTILKLRNKEINLGKATSTRANIRSNYQINNVESN